MSAATNLKRRGAVYYYRRRIQQDLIAHYKARLSWPSRCGRGACARLVSGLASNGCSGKWDREGGLSEAEFSQKSIGVDEGDGMLADALARGDIEPVEHLIAVSLRRHDIRWL